MNLFKQFCIFLVLFLCVLQAGSDPEGKVKALDSFMRRFLGEEQSEPFKAGGIKSGFRYALQVSYFGNYLNQSLLSRYLEKVQERPDREKSLTTPSGHFVLHWDESGSDHVPLMDISGNGVPDYIDSAAVIFDHVWQIEIDLLGFQAPLSEDGKPVAHYDIYFSNLKKYGWYGITQPEKAFEIGSELKYTSYIEIDCNFDSLYFNTAGLAGVRVTAAHEFNHAIQLCYNNHPDEDYFAGDLFFYEMTSTCMEEIVYPGINDYYQYLPLIFDEVSNSPFDRYGSDDTYPYGNALYLLMLSKQYGARICPEIWQEIKSYPVLPALERVLNRKGVSWLESLSEYGVWLYYTGNRTRGDNYFTDARVYGQVTVEPDDTYDYRHLFEIKKEITQNAVCYLNITNVASPELQMGIRANDANRQGFHLLQRSAASPLYPANKQISLQISEPDTICLVLTNAINSSSTFAVTQEKIDIRIDVYPNPLIVKSGTANLSFLNLPANAVVTIYSILGTKITKLKPEHDRPVFYWNLRNDRGISVASGVYLYHVEGEKITKSGKFIIIR